MASRRRSSGKSPASEWRPFPVLVATAIAAAAAAWLAVIFTLNLMAANPSVRALAPLWVGNSIKAATASARLERGQPTPTELAEAQRLATIVVRREPANAVAFRSLGLVASASGDDIRGQQLMTYAERLSRRDLPTQLWLIEKNVATNDIDGALVHYDRALRTNVGARDILIPILTEAAKQPAVAVPLAKMLAKRPLWWTEFADKFIYASDAPDALALTMSALRLDPKKEGERNFLQQTLVSLVEGGAAAKAHSLFKVAVGGSDESVNLVRDGGFDKAPVLAPFDWNFLDETDLGAVRDRRGDGGDWSLFLTAQNGRNGVIARQLLMLSPGTYRLAATGGDMPRDSGAVPVVTLVCADKAGATLGSFRYPAGSKTSAIDAAFSVPATGCSAVWLLVSRSAPLDRDYVTPWVDGFVVQRT